MKILTNNLTGRVILYPKSEPLARDEWTIREVETLPNTPGKLHWDGVALTRIPVTPKPLGLLDAAAQLFCALPIATQEAFAMDFATVRTLIQAGRSDLAKSVITAKQVPTELESVKQQLLAIFQ